VLPDGTTEEQAMGIFYSKDWEIPETEIYASTVGRDILDRMVATMFTSSELYTSKTLLELAEIVLEDYGLTTAQYTIDPELSDYTVPYAWFESDSHRECIRKIVEACAGNAYVGRDGVVQIQGPSFLTATTTAILSIGLDNIWKKSNPIKWTSIANYIEVPLSPLTVATSAEIVYQTPDWQVISAGDTVTETVFYSTSPCTSAIATITARETATSSATAAISLTTTYYAWGAYTSIANSTGASVSYKVYVNAKILSSTNKSIVVSQDAESIRDNGEIKYRLADNNLMQTRSMATSIADKILATYKDPRRDITMDWRGNPALQLTDRITAPDYKDITTQNYYVTSLLFELSPDGLESTLDGRKV